MRSTPGGHIPESIRPAWFILCSQVRACRIDIYRHSGTPWAVETHAEKIQALVAAGGLIRSRDAVAQGIPRVALTRLVRRGLLRALGNGFYAPAQQPDAAHADLAVLGLRHAQGIICLLSALRVHGICVPGAVEGWLAIPNKARAPRWGLAPLHTVRFSGEALVAGIETHVVGGVAVRVTSLARTLADCFKFRNRVGLEVAVHALQAAWHAERVTLDELWQQAHVRRVGHVMRPYLEPLAVSSEAAQAPEEPLPESPQAPKRDTLDGVRVLPGHPAGLLRPIHYLGSKLRLAPAIIQTIQEAAVGRGPILELFSGSGTLSYALTRHRPVVAVDIQEYARVLAAALILPLETPCPALDTLVARAQPRREQLRAALAPILAHEARCLELAQHGQGAPLCALVEQGSLFIHEVEGAAGQPADLAFALKASVEGLVRDGLIPGQAALVSRYYGGTYFSFAQAADLDALLEAAHAAPTAVRDVALAAVISTASAVANTVGKQFAQPLKLTNRAGEPKAGLVAQALRDRTLDVFTCFAGWLQCYRDAPRKHTRRNQAVRDDYRKVLATHPGPFSCIYADPPYTREHYSRFYHVLETLCRRDTPDVATVAKGGDVAIVRGMYRAERHQSPFCIISQAEDAFRALFAGARRFAVPLVLSYSPFNASSGGNPRLLSIQELVGLAREHYPRVEVRPVEGVAHSKLNARRVNKRASADAEVLVICHP